MAKIRFETGQVVNFDGNPTPQDVEEVANKLGIKKQPVAQAPAPQSSTKLGTAAKITDAIFGAGKVGEAIGNTQAKQNLMTRQDIIQPDYANLSESVKQRMIAKGIPITAEAQRKEVADTMTGPSTKEVVGSLGKAALLFTPVGKVSGVLGAGAKALGAGAKLANVAGKVGTGAVTGLGFDVASSLENNESGLDIIKPGMGTLTGGGLPLIGGTVGSALKTGLSKVGGATTASRLTEQTKRLKTLTNAFEKNTRYETIGGKKVVRSNPIKTITDLNLVPEVVEGKVNTDSVREGLKNALDEAFSTQENILAGIKKKVPFVSFADKVRSQIKKDPLLKNLGKTDAVLSQANKLLKTYRKDQGMTFTMKALDDIRKAANTQFSDTAVRDVYRVIGDAAREVVYNSTKDQVVKKILQRESDLFAALDFAERLGGSAVQGGMLGKMLSQLSGATSGAIAGSMVGGGLIGGPIGALVGGVAGSKLKDVAQRSYFKPPLASTAAAINRRLPSVPTSLSSAAQKSVSSGSSNKK